ncbi:tail protein X [Vreelandella janggokensis]|uniref:tail protein X n=1 Tax=Vreelandella janggokensis TaxID=370767 RepID=UPI002855CB0D|nr:tail protein X [Halomonas janggokensis]MDR5887573.1 tail protein X [Halomonas janggokensis]
MARKYRTKDGDTVDWVCWRAYGRLSERITEKVLEANPGVAEHGPLLPGGLQLNLPDIEQPAPTRRIRLWG